MYRNRPGSHSYYLRSRYRGRGKPTSRWLRNRWGAYSLKNNMRSYIKRENRRRATIRRRHNRLGIPESKFTRPIERKILPPPPPTRLQKLVRAAKTTSQIAGGVAAIGGAIHYFLGNTEIKTYQVTSLLSAVPVGSASGSVWSLSTQKIFKDLITGNVDGTKIGGSIRVVHMGFDWEVTHAATPTKNHSVWIGLVLDRMWNAGTEPVFTGSGTTAAFFESNSTNPIWKKEWMPNRFQLIWGKKIFMRPVTYGSSASGMRIGGRWEKNCNFKQRFTTDDAGPPITSVPIKTQMLFCGFNDDNLANQAVDLTIKNVRILYYDD